jgi:putative transposase
MPTHIHLLLKQITDDGISKYMARVLNGYSRFFNIKHKRLGPLWSGRFKNVRVEDDEQFLHLTRYIHLNPTSAGIVEKPEEWENSSYIEYIRPKESQDSICNFKDLLQMTPKGYQKFVEDRKDYQKNISLIKHQMIDDYSG